MIGIKSWPSRHETGTRGSPRAGRCLRKQPPRSGSIFFNTHHGWSGRGASRARPSPRAHARCLLVDHEIPLPIGLDAVGQSPDSKTWAGPVARLSFAQPGGVVQYTQEITIEVVIQRQRGWRTSHRIARLMAGPFATSSVLPARGLNFGKHVHSDAM